MRLDLSEEKQAILQNQYTGITKANFTQFVDHFDVLNYNTWSQEYFVDATHWKGIGYPVFINIGGEWDIEEHHFKRTWCQEYAAEFNALCFILEHRFYGQSHPFGLDHPDENGWKLLTASQALADASTFITEMNKAYDFQPDVKWIAFGCSYGGTLATWLRLKYPNLVHGAVASSAPLLAQLDYPEYVQVVEQALFDQDPQCPLAIKQGAFALDQVQDKSSLICLYFGHFGYCNNEDFDVFYYTSNAVITQYNDFRNLQLNVEIVCEIMTNETIGTPMYRLIELLQQYFEQKTEHKDPPTPYLRKPWHFQVCNEFGWFQTYPLFGYTLEKNLERCKNISGKFDKKFVQKQIAQTNFLFGGKEPEVTNVVFVHGSIDPWSAMGRTEPWPNDDVDVIIVEGASHCQDGILGIEDNWPEMKLAKSKIRKRLQQWFSE